MALKTTPSVTHFINIILENNKKSIPFSKYYIDKTKKYDIIKLKM
jgi:hypothetical protein